MYNAFYSSIIVWIWQKLKKKRDNGNIFHHVNNYSELSKIGED